MNVSEWIAQFLVAQRVDAVFEVAGGMIANFIDALHRDGRVRIVSCHHEQAAGFAAEGHSRITGVPGVAMATSGPGALNLLTALGSCHFDSTPAVFITGQVNRHEQKGSRPVRQLGFQETDIVAVAAPLAKAAWRVSSVSELPGTLAEAFALAGEGRPGPVLVDIPFDLQRQPMMNGGPSGGPVRPADPPAVDRTGVDAILADLLAAERPVILAGGGLRSAQAVPAFRAFVDAVGVPVVSSLMGVDALPFDHELRVGMIGTYGNRWANMALARSDVLLVLGSRLDIRQTGADTAAFAAGRRIHHIDIDPAEVNNRVTGCRALIAGLADALGALTEAAHHVAEVPEYTGWHQEIAALADRWPDVSELDEVSGVNPNALMHQLSNRLDVSTFVADVGQHQMWAAQSLELGPDQRFLTSGGMGAMGSGLPIAVGACLAGGPTALIAGDGGFQLNIQELQTVVRSALPLTMVVLNNRSHGMVRQFQDAYFDGRHPSTVWGYSAPSFSAVASAYGIPARAVEDPEAVGGALAELARHEGPTLLEVAIDPAANAYPKIAFGHPISEMEPFAAPKAIEAT
jgi:acetolactate synthase I/II/III large subunit